MRSKKTNKFVAIFLLSMILGTSTIDSFAQISAECERTTENWAELRDNTIKFEEIDDLVHEYNIDFVKAYIDFREDIHNDKYAADYDEAISRIEENYDKAMERARGDENRELSIQMKYESDRNLKTIDNYAKTNDREIDKLSLNLFEKQKCLSLKHDYIDVFRKNAKIKIDEIKRDDKEREKDKKERAYNLGVATNIDKLDAINAFNDSKNLVESDKSESKRLKENILINLGWNYNADVIFTPIAFEDMLSYTLDIDKDIEKAKDNSIELNIIRRELYLTSVEGGRDILINKLERGIENVESDIRSKASTLAEKRVNIDNRKLSMEKALRDFEISKREYALGSISKREYENIESSSEISKFYYEISIYDYIDALTDYEMAISGLGKADLK